MAQVAPRHRPGGYTSPAPEPTAKSRLWKSVAWALVYLSGFAVFMVGAVARQNAGDVPANTRTTTYTVQSGQTLWTIAESVNKQDDPRAVVDAIQRLNGLGDSPIYPGQVLTVPVQ